MSDLIREAEEWAVALERRADNLAQRSSEKAMGVIADRQQARLLRRLIARAKAWEDVDNADDMTTADVSRAIHGGRALVADADREETT